MIDLAPKNSTDVNFFYNGRSLSYEEMAMVFEYNPNTGEFFKKSKPVKTHKHSIYYFKNNIKIPIKAKRLAWLLYYKCHSPKNIIHIDGDLNNFRISNLKESNCFKVSHRSKIKFYPKKNGFLVRICYKGVFHSKFSTNKAVVEEWEKQKRQELGLTD